MAAQRAKMLPIGCSIDHAHISIEGSMPFEETFSEALKEGNMNRNVRQPATEIVS